MDSTKLNNADHKIACDRQDFHANVVLRAGKQSKLVSLDKLASRLPRLLDKHHSHVHWTAEIEARIVKCEMGKW